MKIPIQHPGAFEKLDFNFDDIPTNLSGLNKINFSWILNASRDVEPSLIEMFTANRSLNGPAFWVLIFMYSVLIVFGATGNSLVVLAVARKPAMRTARNLFIVNLAVSDLLLCLVTMPLTLMEILSKHFPLGKQMFVCKLIGTLQATSIFVSSISITAIALDRYQVIIYPTRESLQVMGAIIILTVIWTIAVVLASPMFIYRTLKSHTISLFGLDTVSFCLEEWPIEHGRAYYSVFSLVVQYIFPIIIVSVAYLRIYFKLKYRYVSTNLARETRERERGRRMKRTNYLLISIAVIYCVSWLPLNLFNLCADWNDEPLLDQQSDLIVYAICHMMGMSSACSNPLLYGWLNDNFKKEFKEILACGRLVSVGRSLRSPGGRKQLPEASQGMKLNVLHSRKGSDLQDITENGFHLTVADTEMTILAR